VGGKSFDYIVWYKAENVVTMSEEHRLTYALGAIEVGIIFVHQFWVL
jgi:hypothetical protein